MKFLMKVGTQLDLDVAYNGGAADAGLIYTAPEDNGYITVNISTGVVDALAEGESVVWVYSGTPSVLVATVVIEVASAATFAERLAIRQGVNSVLTSASAVSPAPSGPVLFSPTALTGTLYTDPASGIQYMEQNDIKVGGDGVSYYGYWSGSFGTADFLPLWDGNGATALVINTGAPTQASTIIRIPVAKRLARVQLDFLQATVDGTLIKVYGQLPTDDFAGGVQNGGSWQQLGDDISVVASGTKTVDIVHGLNGQFASTDVPYQRFKIWLYTHYPPARMDVSAIRLYEPA